MPQATWNGAVIAESDDVVVVEGNSYFPRDAVRADVLAPSDHTTTCGWKGQASYYAVVVDGQRNADAAWEYRDPKPDAVAVRNRIAFCAGCGSNRSLIGRPLSPSREPNRVRSTIEAVVRRSRSVAITSSRSLHMAHASPWRFR